MSNGTLIAYQTIVRKEFVRFARIWIQTILPSVITIFLYTPINANTVLDITENDFLIGEDNAPVTIIEYSSLSCSHCANFHNDTLSLLKNEYIDTN